jgi:hypothetical protein
MQRVWRGWLSCGGLAEIGGCKVEDVGGIVVVSWGWWSIGGRVVVVVAVEWQWLWRMN